MIQVDNLSSSTTTDHINGSMSGGDGNEVNDWKSNIQQSQLSALMLANVLRLGSLTSGNDARGNANDNGDQDHRWFKCVPTENICQFDNKGDSSDRMAANGSITVSTYDRQRREILSLLMPNMVKWEKVNEEEEKEKDDHNHHHQHNISTDLLLNSNELLTELEELLRKITAQLAIDHHDRHASPSNHNVKKCFDREDLLNDLRQAAPAVTDKPEHKSETHHHHELEDINLVYIELLANFIVNRLASGECIELFETKFLRDIIHRYGTNKTDSQLADNEAGNSEQHNQSATGLFINQDGFVKLLNDLHIGGLIENTNEIERRHDHDDHDDHYHKHKQHVKDHELHHGASRGHRSISTAVPFANNPHNHKHIGHSHQHHQPRSSACLDYHYYLSRQGISSGSKVLTENDLRQLSPIFIQQILSGACEQVESRDSIAPVAASSHRSKMNANNSTFESSHLHIDEHDMWKVYLYSSIAVFAISVSSICGVLLIPFLKSQYYSHLINLLIGLAFGCMAGDALFHLLPTVLGIHSHASKNDSHDHDHDHDHEHRHGSGEEAAHDHGNYMWLMVAILATIYALFLFEIFSNFFASKRKGHSHSHGHGHSHSHQQPNIQMSIQSKECKSASSVPTLTKITSNNHDHYSSSLTIDSNITTQTNELENAQALQLYKSSSHLSSLDSMTIAEPDRVSDDDKIPVLFGMTSLALIITIGDSIHNLLDGVAIGIAFSSSIASGISTSIAVFCHELPHEFGDFAVLLSTGLSVRKAAIINFISALTAFIGLYIGILLGNNEAANRWAIAICAGLFLYVALVDMLPELKEMPSTEKGNREWFISMSVKNAGILLGTGFMIILAQYEDLLNFA